MSIPSDTPRDTPQAGPYSGVLASLGKAAWQILLATGVAAIVLGIIILVWPGASLVVVGALFGIYLLVSGVLQLAGAFGAHVAAHMRVLSFVSGALMILLGLICFRGAAESILLLALWIGFGWLLRGILLTAAAIATEGMPARGWQAFLGVITLLAGIVLIISPFGSIAALTLVAGIWLLALGITEVVHGVQLRSRVEHLPQEPAGQSL
ncbi:HdeD family acid-resistance protein [Streptomyces sp. RB6PN25]|uniref:HdeD family acid-resistance protein n=1 Tax=Streptomyces humicola TaxID=2953240 RepID=A0ABT1Q481_9ACTN|nr:HdeD family acid-resistance protein [Streptomyces humicola]MCQ4084731.1 HdeD family acid-resistance protein [Streptomyces humicola]